MKEFVPLDHGGCISSSSSLSPLAPPFKLDTSFPRPISHPLGNIPEPHGREPYFDGDSNYFFAARPPHDNWLQMNSPNFAPNLFPSPNPNPSLSLSLGTNPVLPVCTAPASANGQSTTNFFSSESVSRPYHPQHSSASVQCSIAPFTVDKLDDKLLESGFAPVGGFWNQNNGAQLWEASYPSNYGRQVNQGKSTTTGFPGGDKPKVWVGKSDGSLAGKPYAGSQCTNLSAQKLSESDENSGGVQFATSRASVSNPVSQQEMRYQCATSSNLNMETWSHLNPTIVSYGSHFTGFDPYKQDPLCFYPAASNFYETPSTIGNYAGLVNKTMPFNMNPIEPPKDACNRKETFESQSFSSTACIPVNSERSKIYGDTSRINGLVEENNDPFMDPSMLINVNSPRHTPHRINPMNSMQATDTLVTETREDTAFHCSSEELEQFNPGVDSPCWKGALDSRYTLFGAAEGGGNSFNIQGTQNLPVNSDNAVEFSTLEIQRNGKHFGENGPFSFMKQSSPVVSPSRDICPNFFEGGSNHSQLSNEHVNQYSVPGNTNGGSGIKPSRTNKFSFQKGNVDMKQHNCEGGIADSGIGIKDPANFGTIQFPYHVSDHYSSLLSRDNVPIDRSPTEFTAESFDDDIFNGCKLTGGNVQTMVNLMHNLSESLLSYCSEDEHALKEHDYVVIQQTVQNLDTCLLRVGKMSLMPKTHSPQPETTNCSGNPIKFHKGTGVVRSEATNTKVQDVQSGCYTQNGCEEKKNSSISMKEVDSPPLGFPHNDLDEKDDLTKRIRLILEENFHEEESDMQLYKSLWLEAEAELCSQKYKERFARMKNGMEKYKKHLTNELSDVDKSPSSKVTSEGDGDPIVESRSEASVDREIPKVPIQEHNQLNSSHTDDDASVRARFHILKSRMNTILTDEERQPHDSHLGIEKMLSNPNRENAEDIVTKQQQQEVVEKRNPWTFFRGTEAKDLSKSNCQDMEFGAMQSAITSVLLEHSSGGRSDSPSSGWEHVIKEGTYWLV